jgi:hypothetical protein
MDCEGGPTTPRGCPEGYVLIIVIAQDIQLKIITEDPDNANPSKWHAIAKHVPNRTNKDCRKRWFAKMASDVVKGGWAPDEDVQARNCSVPYGVATSLPGMSFARGISLLL